MVGNVVYCTIAHWTSKTACFPELYIRVSFARCYPIYNCFFWANRYCWIFSNIWRDGIVAGCKIVYLCWWRRDIACFIGRNYIIKILFIFCKSCLDIRGFICCANFCERPAFGGRRVNLIFLKVTGVWKGWRYPADSYPILICVFTGYVIYLDTRRCRGGVVSAINTVSAYDPKSMFPASSLATIEITFSPTWVA